MRSFKANAFAYLVGVFASALWLSGCGGSGSLGGGGTPPKDPTVSSVALTVAPATLQAGATAQATGTVTMSDGTTNHNVTYASDNSAFASVDANSGVVTAKAPGAANITATSTQDSTKKSPAFAVTVAAIPVTITTVTVAAAPGSITTAQTATCVSTVQGTGSFSSAVTWTATNGTITSSGVLTPAAVGAATCTATSTQDPTKSGSASVTVTQAVPAITAVLPTIAYADGTEILGLAIVGTGFDSSDNIKVTSPGSMFSASLQGTTTIAVTLNLDSPHFSPGWFGFTICEADKTTCSNTEYFAFIGNMNTLALGPDGTLYQNDQMTGTAWKFTVSNGVAIAAGNIFGASAIYPVFAVDDKTGDIVGGRGTNDSKGNALTTATDDGNGNNWVGQDANNGLTCGTRPNGNPTPNLVSCFAVGVQDAQLYSNTLGTEPWSVAMGTFSGKTYAFVYSRKTSPMLWKVDATNANTVGSYVPTGFTDSTAIQHSSLMGGWEVVVFEKGPAANTVALLSNYDKLLVFVDASTMQETKRVTLTGNPFRIAKDETNGKLVVASADLTDPANPKTSFTAVDPSASVQEAQSVTALTSTSLNLAVGFAVSSDGKYLYSCQRAACDVQPNK